MAIYSDYRLGLLLNIVYNYFYDDERFLSRVVQDLYI